MAQLSIPSESLIEVSNSTDNKISPVLHDRRQRGSTESIASVSQINAEERMGGVEKTGAN